MRKLSMKVAALSVILVLAALVATGCDSSFQSDDVNDVLNINGWLITSPEGLPALENKSATDVTAVKTTTLSGNLFDVTVSGNAVSVIECVSNPFFAEQNVDYESEYVKNYMMSANYTKSSSIDQKCVEIGIVEHDVSRAPLRDTKYVDLPYGFSLPLGARTSQVELQFTIPYQYYTTDFSGSFTRSIIKKNDFKYASGGTGIVTYGGTQPRTSNFYFGWWDWQITFTVNVPGRTHMSVYWY